VSTVFKATAKAADAPDVEVGLYDATFDGVTQKFIEGGAFGDGDRFEWSFTLLDDDGATLYDEGDPISVQGLTSMSLNTASKTVPKAVRYLKALCTAAEFAAFEDEDGIDIDSLKGRKCQVDVGVRDSGWPTISNVLPPRKARRRSSEADA